MNYHRNVEPQVPSMETSKEEVLNGEEAGEILPANKRTLRNFDGLSYAEFRRGLKPYYQQAWLQLFCGHLGILSSFAAVGFLQYRSTSILFQSLAVLVASVLVGYAVAYITLFFHEASHFNMHPERSWNDRLANFFIGLLTGQDIANYRVVHFDHHRFLGTPFDSEHTYFFPLNAAFLFKSLFGIRALEVLLSRNQRVRSYAKGTVQDSKKSASWITLASALLNAGFIIGSFAAGYWTIAVTWIIGLLAFFPFFAALRQLLEHRDELADGKVDYFRNFHGIVNRLFGEGIIASSFGGAGFNRHLLHHWEPQISYTRLKEIEDFLMNSEAAQFLQARRTTYWETFRCLFRVRS